MHSYTRLLTYCCYHKITRHLSLRVASCDGARRERRRWWQRPRQAVRAQRRLWWWSFRSTNHQLIHLHVQTDHKYHPASIHRCNKRLRCLPNIFKRALFLYMWTLVLLINVTKYVKKSFVLNTESETGWLRRVESYKTALRFLWGLFCSNCLRMNWADWRTNELEFLVLRELQK